MSSPVPRYRAFLSTSIRAEDQPVVTFVERVFQVAGFDCFTVGRNVSAPEPPPETIKREMQRCECLVVVATARFAATDVQTGSVLHLAPGWIDSEAGLAHMRGIPITAFKAKEVTFQGLLGANITQWFEFNLRQETIVEYCLRNRPLINPHLVALKARIDETRTGARNTSLINKLKTIALPVAGAIGWSLLSKKLDPSYPRCFGEFDGRTSICKQCPVNDACGQVRNDLR
jgi:hypothetical protein